MQTSQAINEAVIVVLDFESTGSLGGYKTEPWQIGMVTLAGGRIDPESMYESLLRIDINRPFNPHAPGRHHELRETLAAAPTLHEVWSSIKPRLTHSLLGAHNIATEKKFLRVMAPMHRFGLWIDTLKIARKAWPDCSSYALEDLTAQLGLAGRVEELCPGRKAHDALYDAVASAQLLSHLISQPGWGKVTVAELASL